ncbi:hypothetical protein V8C35DRAFT_293113, partial [Trichoderma chlorosporum]
MPLTSSSLPSPINWLLCTELGLVVNSGGPQGFVHLWLSHPTQRPLHHTHCRVIILFLPPLLWSPDCLPLYIMRRRPRPPVSGASLPSSATLGSRAISSRRSRNRTQQHAAHRNQIHTSRLPPTQQRLSASSSARFYSALSSLIESAAKESKDAVIMASQSFAVPWHRIKLWVEAQEKAEQQGHNPNPLTKTQLGALSHLVSFIEEAEPDIGSKDYVSSLMQLTQQKNSSISAPEYQDVGFDVPINGNFHIRWRTTCSVNHKVFPCEGHGITKGEQPPLFATKKTSKQYAAKHALAYFMAAKSSPSDKPAPAQSSTRVSGGVSIRPAAPPVSTSPKPSDNGVNIGSSSLNVPSGDTGGAPLVPPASPSAETTANNKPIAETQGGSVSADVETYNGDAPSLFKQVVDAGNRLGFGVPQYQIDNDPDNPGCFAGKPTFQNGGRMPVDVGHVTGAITRNAAREAIAEELLTYFKTVLEERHGILNSFTATPAPKELV